MNEPKCPACSAPGLVLTVEGTISCEYCGQTLAKSFSACPSCKHINVAESDMCAMCGEPLTIVSKIMSRQGRGLKPYRLDVMREQAPSIKEQEAIESERRMATFEDVDRKRAEALAEAQEAQRVHTQRVSTILIAVSVLFLVAVVILVFMSL